MAIACEALPCRLGVWSVEIAVAGLWLSDALQSGHPEGAMAHLDVTATWIGCHVVCAAIIKSGRYFAPSENALLVNEWLYSVLGFGSH